MNLEEMAVVICWELDQCYEDVDFEMYSPLVVPSGTPRSDVYELVRHLYGDEAQFEVYRLPELDSGNTFHCRITNLPARNSTTETVVVSDPKGMKPTICLVSDGGVKELILDAKRMYPDMEIAVSRIVQVETTGHEVRYFVLE